MGSMTGEVNLAELKCLEPIVKTKAGIIEKLHYYLKYVMRQLGVNLKFKTRQSFLLCRYFILICN